MNDSPLRIAVVGHTNTGKTSLLRTVMRDVSFGEVSDHPAVTRHVEGAAVVLGSDGGSGRRVEWYDTPGLEDSISLLDLLETMRAGRRVEGIDLIQRFLDKPESHDRFAQEAKALRQVLTSDVALYIIDARDRVLGKHRDELSILAYCARPIVPVLNFVAAEDARTKEWREQLSRAAMHAVAEFDTVAFDAASEQRLLEKMRTLLDSHGELLTELIEDRRDERARLIAATGNVIAELLVDAASHVRTAPTENRRERDAALDAFRKVVVEREQACIAALLELHRFRADDCDASALPIEDGRWGVDLFSPAAMRQFGIQATGGAAAGAMVGLTLDVMLAGLSLGTGTLIGAAAGAMLGVGRSHGRQMIKRARGMTEVHCDNATLALLAARQVTLAAALLRRGHASVTPMHLADAPAKQVITDSHGLVSHLDAARLFPGWSKLSGASGPGSPADPRRQSLVEELAEHITAIIRNAADQVGRLSHP
ncbi:MAG: GTPase/DUF3482 domain-containing protein [Phycisphaerales bacterium]|nr:GTPase/DUF3482 domain-containing protein [Phycisphaerales bacterium]